MCIMHAEVGRNAIPPYFDYGHASSEFEGRLWRITARSGFIRDDYDGLGIRE